MSTDTDRELLEAAAKAAGFTDAKWADMAGWGEARHGFSAAIWTGEDYWNPLEDSAAALDLAVKLEIDLSFYSECGARVYAQTKHLLGYGTDGRPSYQAHVYNEEPYGDDPMAATRRAIVRAAAAIGSGG